MQIVEELRAMFFPSKDDKHGPLVPLLVVMTVASGLVDGFSYLVLGHVFVANMTGNILFLGFALAGVHGLSVVASIVALAAFVVGAAMGGRIDSRHKGNRGLLLAASSEVEAVFMTIAFVLSILCTTPVAGGYRYALIISMSPAMGVQNSGSRKLAVPDLTTTVLTMTITGIGADSTLVGGPGSRVTRRMVALLLGAFTSALLVLHAPIFLPLMIALIIVVAVGVGGRVLGSSSPAWTTS